MKLAVGVGLAIASACALNWGFFVQHGVAAALPPLSLRRPLRSLRALFTSPRWLLGYGVGIGGWGLYIIALSMTPLSIVQAASGGGIGVLAFLAFRGAAPSPRERAGVAAAIGGLVLLGISLIHQSNARHAVPGMPAALWIAVSLGVVAVLTFGVRSGAALGAGAGLLYASGDIATKAAFASAHHLWFVLTLLACHGLGFVALQRGFQLGDALQTAGISTMLTNSVPIAAGIAIFHEGMPAGALGVTRGLAFALVLFAAVVLARGPGTHVEQPAATTGSVPASLLN